MYRQGTPGHGQAWRLRKAMARRAGVGPGALCSGLAVGLRHGWAGHGGSRHVASCPVTAWLGSATTRGAAPSGAVSLSDGVIPSTTLADRSGCPDEQRLCQKSRQRGSTQNFARSDARERQPQAQCETYFASSVW